MTNYNKTETVLVSYRCIRCKKLVEENVKYLPFVVKEKEVMKVTRLKQCKKCEEKENVKC